MYLWNTAALAQDLKLGQVTNDQKINYYICTSFLTSIILWLTALPQASSTFNWHHHNLSTVVELIMTFFFLKQIYETNEKGDGESLLDRLLCLSVPLVMKFILSSVLMGLLLGFCLILIENTVGRSPLYTTIETLFWVIFDILLLSLYYHRLKRWVSEVSSKKSTELVEP